MSKYIYLGSRIYYLKTNGNIIFRTYDSEGHVKELTTEDDWRIYTELSKYNKSEVDFMELQFGEFKTEFAECTSYRVNVDTKQLEFDYTPIPEPPDVPTSPTLHERMETQENRNNEQDDIMFEQSYKIAMLELNTASLSSLE